MTRGKDKLNYSPGKDKINPSDLVGGGQDLERARNDFYDSLDAFDKKYGK